MVHMYCNDHDYTSASSSSPSFGILMEVNTMWILAMFVAAHDVEGHCAELYAKNARS